MNSVMSSVVPAFHVLPWLIAKQVKDAIVDDQKTLKLISTPPRMDRMTSLGEKSATFRDDF